MKSDPKTVFAKLLAYCRANEWAGYDPYDALNSRLLSGLPILRSRVPRVILTQALKRSPINLRRLLLVPKMQNPKAIALAISALLKLEKSELADQDAAIDDLAQRLAALRSPKVQYWCWGYSFAWQTRTVMVPAGAPNLISTTFAANALLDAYEQRQDARYLEMALSAAEYLVRELYWSEGAVAGFGYPLPSLRSKTHNANFLGAALLARAWRLTGDESFLGPALAAARYSASLQNADGSWYYGEASSQRWIDNFHTGYNLCALQSISRSVGTTEFASSIQRGFEFYRANFFRADGAPRYFHNCTYPIDIHCVAQSITTLLAFSELDPEGVSRARSVFEWAMDHLWDSRGFFYYRVLRTCTIRTSYMRWSQAWMLLALATLVSESDGDSGEQPLMFNAAASTGSSRPTAAS